MRLRFAAPPTALLHVGQARIALAAYLVARRNQGQFLLRLDDAEPDRARPGVAEAIQHDLAWLGLDWDDTVTQSARLDAYTAAADRLRAAGRLYPCFEGEDELTFKRELRQRQGKPTIYDRAMLKMTAEQRARAEAGGKRPYWRFLLSGIAAEWGDMVLGRQSVKLSAISDPVLVRADGTPLPAFATAVDDMDLGITHVVREADQVTGSGIQLDILAALGARPHAIRFSHLPALADSAARAGKRPSFPTLRSLRADGIEPAALCGTIAALGTPDRATPAPAALLAPTWDLTRVSATVSPVFDPQALLAANRLALQTMPFEAAQDRLPAGATPAFWHAIHGSIDLLREARLWWNVVAGSIAVPALDDHAVFHDALATLPPEPWDGSTWETWIERLATATGIARHSLAIPLRLVLTGEHDGPDLANLLPLMGQPRTANRLRHATRTSAVSEVAPFSALKGRG